MKLYTHPAGHVSGVNARIVGRTNDAVPFIAAAQKAITIAGLGRLAQPNVAGGSGRARSISSSGGGYRIIKVIIISQQRIRLAEKLVRKFEFEIIAKALDQLVDT